MTSAGSKWLAYVTKSKGEWFDYSNANYISAKTKVNIVCKVCNNSFEQTPDSHRRRPGRKGCLHCAGKKYTTETIKEKIRSIHGDRYGLDKVRFTKTRDKITLVCKIHGEFSSRVNSILSKGTGCIKCAEAANGRACRTTVPEFIKVVESKFTGKYSYPELNFESIDDTIHIVCPIHGEFTQTAKEHMASVYGCKKCSTQANADKLRGTVETFIQKASAVHSNYYTYDKAIYVDSKTPLTITCPIHGDFEQAPGGHLSGRGCQSCASYGFKDYLPAVLYYVKVEHGPFTAYKIGITNKSVDDRFTKDLDKITILKVWEYPEGKNARSKEKTILNSFKVYKWTGPDLLYSGNTELFDRDVLELDNGDNYE